MILWFIFLLLGIHYCFLSILMKMTVTSKISPTTTHQTTYYRNICIMAGLATFANVVSNYSLRYNTLASSVKLFVL